MLKFLYNTSPGRFLLKGLLNPSLSKACGRFLDSPASVFLIKPFVRRNHIDLSLFYADNFKCFNDCFCRKIKEGERPVDMADDSLISPCDAYLSAYKITKDTVFPVKQSAYTLLSLLRSKKLTKEYEDGLCLVYRLCVNHYHRYCYIDSGIKGKNRHIDGILHTVQPIALRSYPVFVENSREYTIMETKNFGRVIQMEVGAMLVGKIKNYHGKYRFLRGEEKGLFMYGGSTIIVLLKKDAAYVDRNIMEATKRGIETPVKMGQRVGVACKP